MFSSLKRDFGPSTTIIFLITICVYVLQVILDYLLHFAQGQINPFILLNSFFNGPSIQSLILSGAQVKALVFGGQWFRLIIPIFLHASLMHIFSNMLALIIVGPYVENLFGSIKFLIIYFVSGIWGNLFALIFDPNSTTISVGASGAIFGLFGAMISVAWYNRNNYIFRRQLFIFVALAVFNLVGNLGDPSVDIWAHIGGLISGALSSLIIDFPSTQYGKIKIVVKVIAILIMIIPLYIVIHQVIS
ncbi:rhomboid family intramembrane serine protease [Oenococcus alcoholitolerans]|uniref:rhomboid family intramembrane serine protease n=1 Tax=Oenococcus alcoholitolerans TaxID=931074 RepID=UPI003F719750